MMILRRILALIIHFLYTIGWCVLLPVALIIQLIKYLLTGDKQQIMEWYVIDCWDVWIRYRDIIAKEKTDKWSDCEPNTKELDIEIKVGSEVTVQGKKGLCIGKVMTIDGPTDNWMARYQVIDHGPPAEVYYLKKEEMTIVL